MKEHAHEFPILKMSELLDVSRSGYYKWLKRKPSKRSKENKALKTAIKDVWEDSRCCYGSPRIYQELCKKNYTASRPRIARIMKAMGIASRIRPKWITTTQSDHSLKVAPNRLNRNFTPTELGRVWVSDITYLPSREGWLYLTTVIDLADRQVIGWSLSRDMTAENTSIAALKQAMIKRRPSSELLFHSDRGIQYACEDFTDILEDEEIQQSMSRKGNCWDNAPAESFFKTFKAELPLPEKFENYEQARRMIFDFIEIWYNRKRLHSTLDYDTPAERAHQLRTSSKNANTK